MRQEDKPPEPYEDGQALCSEEGANETPETDRPSMLMEGYSDMSTENISPTPSKEEEPAQAAQDDLLQPAGRPSQRKRLHNWLLTSTYASPWLPIRLRSWFVGYILAVVLQLLTFLSLKLFIPAHYTNFNFIEAPVLLVVLCTAFFWGNGPGILAALVGTLLLLILNISPLFPPEVRKLEDGVSIFLYLAVALVSGTMISQARRMQADAMQVRERGMEENKQQLYDLLKRLPIPISVMSGPEHRFEFVSPLTQQIVGKREILGQPIRAVLPEYGPQGIFDLLDQVYMTGKSLTIPQLHVETLHYQDGPPVPINRYFSVVYQPLHTELGGVDGVAIFNIDITEQVLANQQKERMMMERERERDHLRAVLEREQELRQIAENATRRLQTVLEVLPVGVTITDATGRIVQRNAATLKIWGQSLTDANDLAEYRSDLGRWAETGKPVLAKEWPLAQALLQGKVVYDQEIDVLGKDGERKTFLYFAAPIRNEQGQITGGVAAGLDMTQRRRLELRLRETELQTRESLRALLVLAEALVSTPIADAAETTDPTSAQREVAQRLIQLIRSVLNCKRVSISVFDPQTHEIRSLAVTGISPEVEQAWRERRPGFHLSELIEGSTYNAQLLTGNVVVMDMSDPSFATKANVYGITTILIAPMRVGTRMIGILALDYAGDEHEFSDGEKALAKAVAELAALILERERLQAERAASHARVLALQETNRLKDEFIGIAGHELRTPLTTVKASVQLTSRQVARLLKMETNLSPEAQKSITTMQGLLKRVERQIGMQNRLINDLLDISRIEMGRLELHLELCNLVALVQEVVEDQQSLTQGREVSFEQNTLEEVLVLVDADRLRQVITNYLSNALKYSASDQPVSVRIVLFESEVHVEVEDKGPGLTEAEQEHIWQRFYRVPDIEVRSGSGVGLGLGLHISRTIIERHNGYVGVRSRKGEGSVFWLALPLAE